MSFTSYIKKNYTGIILISYLLPILFAVIVSLAHVVTFWEVTNPASWAVFLSIAIEVAVLSSIAASRISNWAWLPFGIVTFIQIIGNVFFSYTNIDTSGSLFANWVELFDPLFNWLGFGTDGDFIVHKRILATFSGAMIPLISITFFHFFIRTARMGDNPLVDVSYVDLGSGAAQVDSNLFDSEEPEVSEEPEGVLSDEIIPVKSLEGHMEKEAMIQKWRDLGFIKDTEWPLKDTTETPILEDVKPEIVPVEDPIKVVDPNQTDLFDQTTKEVKMNTDPEAEAEKDFRAAEKARSDEVKETEIPIPEPEPEFKDFKLEVKPAAGGKSEVEKKKT